MFSHLLKTAVQTGGDGCGASVIVVVLCGSFLPQIFIVLSVWGVVRVCAGKNCCLSFFHPSLELMKAFSMGDL